MNKCYAKQNNYLSGRGKALRHTDQARYFLVLIFLFDKPESLFCSLEFFHATYRWHEPTMVLSS